MQKKKASHKKTQQRLDALKRIDTSKKTQDELAKILGYSGPEKRKATSIFLKRHNIPFMPSRGRIMHKRLEAIKKIKNIEQKSIMDIAKVLGFHSVYAAHNTRRFLKQHDIDY